MEGSWSFMQNWTRRDCWWDADSTPSDSDRHAKNLWLTIKYRPLTTSSCEGNLQKRETRRRANADAMREARARESREEGETRWRANADAMREVRARWIADRGWQTLPVHRMPHPHPLRLPLSVQEVLLFTPQRTHKSSWSERSYLHYYKYIFVAY